MVEERPKKKARTRKNHHRMERMYRNVFSVGDLVAVRSKRTEKWRDAIVTVSGMDDDDKHKNCVKIHFLKFSSNFDEWFNCKNGRIAGFMPLLQIGDKAFAQSCVTGQWRQIIVKNKRIVGIDHEKNEILVGFSGLDTSYDEWINQNSVRLATTPPPEMLSQLEEALKSMF